MWSSLYVVNMYTVPLVPGIRLGFSCLPYLSILHAICSDCKPSLASLLQCSFDILTVLSYMLCHIHLLCSAIRCISPFRCHGHASYDAAHRFAIDPSYRKVVIIVVQRRQPCIHAVREGAPSFIRVFGATTIICLRAAFISPSQMRWCTATTHLPHCLRVR